MERVDFVSEFRDGTGDVGARHNGGDRQGSNCTRRNIPFCKPLG
ncbi:hypothetical protein [Arthrobacter luteolus]